MAFCTHSVMMQKVELLSASLRLAQHWRIGNEEEDPACQLNSFETSRKGKYKTKKKSQQGDLNQECDCGAVQL